MRDFLKGKNVGSMLLIIVLLLALSVGGAVYNAALSGQHVHEEESVTKKAAETTHKKAG